MALRLRVASDVCGGNPSPSSCQTDGFPHSRRPMFFLMRFSSVAPESPTTALEPRATSPCPLLMWAYVCRAVALPAGVPSPRSQRRRAC